MAHDARVSSALINHPKTKKLRRRLGPAACWSLVALFAYASEHRSDGDLSGMSDEDIAIAADWDSEPDKLVTVLVEVNFLEGASGLYKVHDWAQHQPYALNRAMRIEAAKLNGSAKWANKAINDATRSERLSKARAIGRHSAGDWQALLKICADVCVRCGGDGPLVKDHITPIYMGGSDGIDNLQPLCKPCNSSKGPDTTDFRPTDWQERLQNVCATPTPNQTKPNTIKPSAAKPAAVADSRFDPAKKFIERCCEHAKVPFLWGPGEAKQLSDWLKQAPGVDLEGVQQLVRNRYRSNEPPGKRPREWIPHLSSYAVGPVDRFGKDTVQAEDKLPNVNELRAQQRKQAALVGG